MKKLLFFLFLVVSSGFIYNYREELLKFYDQYFVPIEDKITKLEKNDYYRNYDFSYVKNTDDFIAKSKDNLLNIYYTIVNSGMNDFTFYCHPDYANCINDVYDLANDQETVSNINNFVHPYNSFKSLSTEVESTGKVTLHLTKVYDDNMIVILNYKVDEIIKKEIKPEDSARDKIKIIHDYIINNSKYDKERSDNKIINYKSDNAYGVLIENFGLCGGYTDAMMLFLEKFNIPNYKISTENHVWNYVKVEDKWWHLDLTWDDPVAEDGRDILDDSYFLITDATLFSIEKKEHNYDKEIYAS